AEHWNTCTCGKEDVDRAQHDFEWVVDQDATADKPGSKHERCKTCGYERESVEIPAFGITGYSGIYDGEKHGVTVNAETVASIQYREKGEKKWSDESPLICDAGSKTVEFKAALTSGDTCEGEVELKVDPRPVTVKPKDASKVYGYDDPDFELEAVEGSIIKGHPLSWFKIRREAGENVGTYTLTIEESKVGDKWDKIQRANYAPTLQTGTFEITTRQIGVGWTVGTYTYNGKRQGPKVEPTNVVKCDEGKVSYEVENATGIDAGSYPAKVTGLAGDPEVIKNYALPTENLEYTYTIYKAEQEKPQGLKATAETIRGKCDGKIKGAHGGVAYRLFHTEAGDADGETMVSEDGKIENLAAGDYKVWYAETDNYLPSAPVEVHVDNGKYLWVTLSDKNDAYSIVWHSPNRLQWHESVEFSVKISDGYYVGDDFAVKANGVVLEKGEDGTFVLSNVEEKTTITVEGVRKHEAVNEEWLSDDSTHWHKCACGDKIDEAKHDFEWVVVKAPTATEKGSKQQKCKVCGHKLAEVEIPAAAIVGYSDEYDGDYHTVDATSLPEGATAQYSTDGKNWSPEAPKIKDVGTLTVSYEVTIDGVKAEGEVALEVKPCAITVTAQDASKTYGEADPVFTWDVTSGKLIAGETLQGIEIDREDSDNVREG
ncbi:MBG domain-containing protein, partial [Alistipes putredinis]|uniref:MBG domain-containing protein n=1 Tax=Alistipes putredinis TaxID=28117 RepID=UPI003AB13917